MANKFSSVTVTGYNSSPPPDDGSNTGANEITWAGQKSKLADPLKTAIDALNSNALSAFGQQLGYNIESVSTDLTLGAGDTNKFIVTTGSHTLTLPAAATAGSSTLYAVINGGSGTTTIDGNGSETIDGALTITLTRGQFALIGTDGAAWVSASNRAPVLRGFLGGLTLSRNSGTPNTKIDVAAGQATDDGNVALLTLGSTATIDTGSVGANGLDAGTLALSTWYHAYVIAKLDGTTAGLLSTSASAPTMPSGYVFKRRLGSVKTDASTHFLKFLQDGDYFWWDVPVQDVINGTLSTASRTLVTTSTPLGVNVTGIYGALLVSGGANARGFLTDPAMTDTAVGNGAFSFMTNSTASGIAGNQVICRTNTSSQIGTRGDAALTYDLITSGWFDTRGRFA